MKVRHTIYFSSIIITSHILSACHKQNCESSKQFTVQGRITERVTDLSLSGTKVYIACNGPLDDLMGCGLIGWLDSTLTDQNGNFTFVYPGGKDLEDQTGNIGFTSRGWDCTASHADFFFDSSRTTINLYGDPLAYAELNFHNSTGIPSHGARIVVGCNQEISVSGQIGDTTVSLKIAGASFYKLDWEKMLNGNDVEEVPANDSVYVAPGDTLKFDINY